MDPLSDVISLLAAEVTAMLRAVHLLWDDRPKIFEDTLALQLSGCESEAALHLLALNPGGEWGHPGGCAKEQPREEKLAGVQGGIAHFGYMLRSLEEYERVIASVAEFGGKLVMRCDHGGLFTHTYLADPDGYVCEIQYGQ